MFGLDHLHFVNVKYVMNNKMKICYLDKAKNQ